MPSWRILYGNKRVCHKNCVTGFPLKKELKKQTANLMDIGDFFKITEQGNWTSSIVVTKNR